MKLTISCALLVGALLSLSGCNKAKSPEDVQADVAKAQSNAVEENAKADQKVKEVEAAAPRTARTLAKVADKNVDVVADSAVTEAEGDTKIALAKCEAL